MEEMHVTAKLATIKVRTRCTCNARRWFMCTCAYTIAEYECASVEGLGAEPLKECVDWVRAQHPHDDLIFFTYQRRADARG
jgi:hypothetical protein